MYCCLYQNLASFRSSCMDVRSSPTLVLIRFIKQCKFIHSCMMYLFSIKSYFVNVVFHFVSLPVMSLVCLVWKYTFRKCLTCPKLQLEQKWIKEVIERYLLFCVSNSFRFGHTFSFPKLLSFIFSVFSKLVKIKPLKSTIMLFLTWKAFSVASLLRLLSFSS